MDDVIVDENVTLTISPGTQIKFNSTLLMNDDDFSNFIYYNGTNIAKNLIVNGNIIAEGTEDDPIIFTRYQDSLYYHWGVIYLTEDADRCVFKYCDFSYSARMMIYVGLLPIGSISIYSEETIIENCDFYDNFCGVFMQCFPQEVIVKNCEFYNIQNINPNVASHAARGIRISAGASGEAGISLIAGNRFNEANVNSSCISMNDITSYVAFNELNEKGINLGTLNDKPSFFFNNDFIDCYEGINGGDIGDSLYIKSNRFFCEGVGIEINEGYVEVSDNYFEGCNLDTELQSSGKVYNNILANATFCPSSYLEVYNNIGYYGIYGLLITYRNEKCQNNISVNNIYAFDGYITGYFENCIFLGNENITQYGVSGNPTFRNCIFDFELPPECIDGGGNISVDSLQAQSIFVDIQNGDFHLVTGSIAIDAGFDSLGYYYPFDMDYNQRVWDGDGNGTAIIDIGPYEFGSPAFGGIEGVTYNPINGDPVDYVLIKINNISGEFTFSDSIGNFEYKLPAGVYDVYAERVFYDDVIEYQVEVIEGEFTELNIPMCETVEVEEHEIPHNSLLISHFSNYPNPFNPSTTISFELTAKDAQDAKIEIFNLKGQKVRTFTNHQITQSPNHQIVWDGTDQNNQPVSSGIYFVRLKAGEMEASRKIMLLK